LDNSRFVHRETPENDAMPGAYALSPVRHAHNKSGLFDAAFPRNHH